MDTEFQNKIVKCRISHTCQWCGEIIEKDDSARSRAGVFDGHFFHAHQHLECYTAMSNSDVREGFYPHEQLRGITIEFCG